MALIVFGQNVADAYIRFRRAMVGAHDQLQQRKGNMASGSVNVMEAVAVVNIVKDAKAVFARLAGVPGLVAYAKSEAGEDDANYDVAGEYQASIAALDAVAAAAIAAIPDDGTYIATHTLDAESGLTPRQLPAATFDGVRNAIDAFAATLG